MLLQCCACCAAVCLLWWGVAAVRNRFSQQEEAKKDCCLGFDLVRAILFLGGIAIIAIIPATNQRATTTVNWFRIMTCTLYEDKRAWILLCFTALWTAAAVVVVSFTSVVV